VYEMMDRVVVDLHSRGVPKSIAGPPLWRFLWKVGFAVRPPIFQNVGTQLMMGGVMGTVWALAMRFALGDSFRSANVVVGAAAIFGLLWFATLSVYSRWKLRALNLTSWETYEASIGERPLRTRREARRRTAVLLCFSIVIGGLVLVPPTVSAAVCTKVFLIMNAQNAFAGKDGVSAAEMDRYYVSHGGLRSASVRGSCLSAMITPLIDEPRVIVWYPWFAWCVVTADDMTGLDYCEDKINDGLKHKNP
jgi:hypothetical protein